jgi:flagella basal body P-ring formation protein FlgA
MPWKAVILDVPAHSFPDGQIVLKPSGLVARRDAEHLWRGALLLPDKSSLPIWVRLELRSLRHVRTLNRPLPLGAAVTPADFTDEEKWLPGLCPASRAQFDPAGLVTRQSLPLGAELLPLHFRRTATVRRGDTVDVSLRAGPALLKVQAVAEHDADTGRPVLLKSAWNGSRITARVTGPGKAEIEP